MRARIVPAQLKRRVYEQLRDEILSGAAQPGTQLVEARIAAELGVSKTPVREALIRLQRDGLVAIEPYRGARVIEPSPADVREILELRVLLEAHVARDLAGRRPPEVLERLERSIADGRRALERGNDARVRAALTEFSDVMAESSGNRRLGKSLDEHERILTAIQTGDADGAAAATEAHIRSIEADSTSTDGAIAVAGEVG